MNPRKRQEGFTIIELVVVIAIVAIMAAVALPRFVDLQVEARDASLNAVFGGYQAAIQLVHAKWLANTASPTTVPLEGATVIVNAAGWPTIDALKTEHYDALCSRPSPAFPKPGNECITLYGDSFTYGEEVDHEDAWSNRLAERIGCHVGNYGVGGYGSDQALLR